MQLAAGNLAQASIQDSLGNSAMSDVSTTDVVSFKTCGRSFLSNGGIASSEGPDANMLLFGAGCHAYVLPNVDVNEPSRTNRLICSKAQDELTAMEQNARLAVFHQNQQFQFAVRGHQRPCRLI